MELNYLELDDLVNSILELLVAVAFAGLVLNVDVRVDADGCYDYRRLAATELAVPVK